MTAASDFAHFEMAPGLGDSKYVPKAQSEMAAGTYKGPVSLSASRWASLQDDKTPVAGRTSTAPAPTMAETTSQGSVGLGASKYAALQAKAPAVGLASVGPSSTAAAKPRKGLSTSKYASSQNETAFNGDSYGYQTYTERREADQVAFHAAFGIGGPKHATPQHETLVGGVASAAPSPAASVASNVSKSTGVAPQDQIEKSPAVALKEQIVNTNALQSMNPDAQLALAQHENIKKEIQKQSAALSTMVDDALALIFKCLRHLHDHVHTNDGGEKTLAIQTVWDAVQKLADAVKEAWHAVPDLLRKQHDAFSLFHNSVVNAAYAERQEELDAQHKKVRLQHDIILQHQQVFNDYKNTIEPQLKELSKLQGHMSNMSLQTNRTQAALDDLNWKLDVAQAEKQETVEKLDNAVMELGVSRSTIQELTDDREKLHKTIDGLEQKLASTKKTIMAHFEQEIQRLTNHGKKEAQKADALDTLVKELRAAETSSQQVNEKLEAELKAFHIKCDKQVTEISGCFRELNDEKNKVAALTQDVERLQTLNHQLEGNRAKIDDLEKKINALQKRETDLTTQLEGCRQELQEATVEQATAEAKAESLETLFKKTSKVNEDMEEENNNLLAKIAEYKKTCDAQAATLTKVQTENAALKAASKQSSSRPVSHDNTAMEGDLRRAQEEIAGLQKEITDWQQLAAQSYGEYKQILPVSKMAENLCQENEDLKKQLATKSQTNGGGVNTEAAHWRAKYDALLADFK